MDRCKRDRGKEPLDQRVRTIDETLYVDMPLETKDSLSRISV